MKTRLSLFALAAFTTITIGTFQTAQADSWRGAWSAPGRGYGSYGNSYSGYNRSYGAADRLVSNGIRSGQLSWREVREVRRDQNNLRRKQAAYLSDGYLSRWERNDLRNERKDLYKDLRHNLRDGERRW